jgi:hypothetical protein
MKAIDILEDMTMADKNHSWKGSPNAGLVLTILAGLGAVAILFVGFSG